jgi:Protein of unknown function (DUF2800)
MDDSLAHAKFAPSSLGMFEKCPGYRNRTETEQDKSDAAEKGTRIHKALEKDAIDDLPDEEERHVAQALKDYVDEIIMARLPALPSIDRRELRLTVDLSGGLYTYGTCDRLLMYGNLGIMLDYKTGYLEVEDAETNAQVWSYVIGAFQKYKELDVIEFYLLVPNQDAVYHHIFKREEMPEMQLRLNTIIRRAQAFDWDNPEISKLNPQPRLCEYCAYQAICPALSAKHLTVAKKLLPGLPVPPSVRVDDCSPEEIAQLLRLTPFMEDWISEVRSQALKKNMEEGLEIPGFKRIERSTPRTVTSVIATWDALKDDLTIEDFLMACSKVSIPDLEEYFAQQARNNPNKKRGDISKSAQALENKLRANDVLVDGGSVYYMKERKAN